MTTWNFKALLRSWYIQQNKSARIKGKKETKKEKKIKQLIYKQANVKGSSDLYGLVYDKLSWQSCTIKKAFRICLMTMNVLWAAN